MFTLLLAVLFCVYVAGEFYQRDIRKFAYTHLPNTEKNVFLGDSIVEQGDFSYVPGAVNRGLGDNRTSDILGRLDNMKDAQRIYLLVGVNDVGNEVPLDTIKENYANILGQLEDTPTTVLSIIYTDQPALNARIKDVNAFLEENSDYIDLNAVLSQDQSIRPEYSVDGIHINARAYDAIKPLILQRNDDPATAPP